ncbi:uncharacterized protein G2W53_008452 [Senna tora]|uniref:Uncharacterized protein n=1 Tax=Senna tora TaxID=362788 RepID=A0A835CH17_9FABA|nr:uncharacterized protein G2W53_008452 [Senna tora]
MSRKKRCGYSWKIGRDKVAGHVIGVPSPPQ